MLLNLTSHVAAMEASTCASAGEAEPKLGSQPSHCSNLVTEYSNVFEPRGMAVEHEINHKIELKPGAAPPYHCQYCVSAAELAKA